MLKSLLTLLLSKFVKKADTKFIASQPMPGNYGDIILLGSELKGDIDVTYTAPTNGWAAVAGGNYLTHLYLVNNRSGLSARLHNKDIVLLWPHVYLPCAKGDTFRITSSVSASQTDGTNVSFLPSIGG